MVYNGYKLMKKIDITTIQKAAVILKAIGHKDRLRIVEALEKHPKTVSQLMKEIRLAQVPVSKHLAILKAKQIVQSKGEGTFRYYSISYRNVINVLNCLRQHGGK